MSDLQSSSSASPSCSFSERGLYWTGRKLQILKEKGHNKLEKWEKHEKEKPNKPSLICRPCPSSNTCFEFQLQKIRQFPLLLAQMSVVKSKLTNQMSLQSLNSILYIRYGLKLSGEACYEHQLPDNVDDPLFL